MSDSKEVIPEKKGRGRSAAEKSDLYGNDPKRKAEPESDDSKPMAKKGRGRPKGSTKKNPTKKAEPKAKASRKSKKKTDSSEGNGSEDM